MSGARLVEDMSDVEYHRDPALSASGAKKLLSPSCPALYRYDRDHGPVFKAAFDLGHAAHAKVLGAGAPLVVVQKIAKDGTVSAADDYLTVSARAHRDEIRAEGSTPVLASELSRVNGMAAALREHPVASALLDPERGRPEVSAFWHDEDFGIDRRARFDWLPHQAVDGVLQVPDFKSTTSAEPRAFTRSIWNFGYDVQAVFYADAVLAAGLARDVRFTFIAQETTPPYLVGIYELDDYALMVGRKRVNEACALFRDCTASGEWPGWAPDVQYVAPPAYLADEYGIDDMEVISHGPVREHRAAQ